MDIFAAAMAHLSERLEETTAIAIVYSREGDFGSESATLTATRGSTPFESQDNDGIITRIESRDYIVRTESFPFELPQSGDLVTDGSDRYEVQSLPGFLPYRFSDPSRKLLRIHTKRISPEI